MDISRSVFLAQDDISDSEHLESNGVSVSFENAKTRQAVCSIVDSNGDIIKHAHKWLHYLCFGIGISVSEKTVEQYSNSILYLCRWIETEKPYPSLTIDESLELLSRQDIQSWQQYNKARGTAGNNSLNAREVAVKSFLTWLTTIEAGGVRSLKDSPWGRENKLPYIVKKSSPKSPKFITANEIIGILKGLHSESERCMFHMQYDTGLRISELVSLRLKDLPSQSLYQDQNFSYIPLYIKGAKGKAGQDKERVSIISRAVLNRIRKYHSSVEYRTASQWRIHDPEKPVFLTSNSLMWTVRNAQKQFKTAVKRSGVSEDFVTHWMRHGTAFSILTSDIGKDYQDKMLTIQSVLGHSNISTTEIYTQISPAILTMLNSEGKKQDRLSEAEYIRAETFLSPLKHKEKRGKYER